MNKATLKKGYIKSLASNTFFSVRFVKKDGSIRDMRCRFGVKKNLNPNSKGLTETQSKSLANSPYLVVTDLDKEAYRKINISTILSLKARRLTISRESLEEDFVKT